VLAGKGGIGKTFVASLLAQVIASSGEPVLSLDADPVNASLTEITALRAEPVRLFLPGSDEPDIDAMDAMIERIVGADSHVVLDNGAASFVPLSRYLVAPAVLEAIEAAGKRLVVHTLVSGGPELTQTVRGFDSIASQFPHEIPIVLWVNPHHGSITGSDGASFRDTPVFRKHAARISGIIDLPRFDRHFAKSIAAMQARGLTFSEAAQSGELYVMDRQRIAQVRRQLWEQVEAALR